MLGTEWLHANRDELSTNEYNRERVMAAFIEEDPQHALWHHFERVYVRSLVRTIALDPATWGIGSNPRVIAPDIELLYLQDTAGLSGGVWWPGEERRVMPILIKLNRERWRVLNVDAETPPEPGWPPKLD